jgi:hypothetical protein
MGGKNIAQGLTNLVECVKLSPELQEEIKTSLETKRKENDAKT